MLGLKLRRASREDIDEELVDDGAGSLLDEQLPPVSDWQAQATSTLSTKAATVLLWGALLLGPLGAVLGAWLLFQPAPVQPVAAAVTSDADADEQASASEFAQRVVVAWLSATRSTPEELEALVADPPATLPEHGFTVEDVSTAGVVSQGGGVWAVTVAATVTDERDERHRRYLQVPVMVAGESVAALTLPAVVSAPVVAQPPATTYRSQVASTSPLSQTVAGFLQAYLTGSGDLARYLTPGAELVPVTPPPFTAVKVLEVRAVTAVEETSVPPDGEQAQVRVEASGTVLDDQTLATTYVLALTARAGRWEVTSLESAPAEASRPPESDQDSGLPSSEGARTTPSTGD